MKSFLEIGRFVALLWLLSASANAHASLCSGKVPNPITDICWKCIFPIKIGGAPVATQSQEDSPDVDSSPVCVCPAPPPLFVRVGVSVSFWEPIRLLEVVREPYCFPTLGGVSLGSGVLAPRGTRTEQAGAGLPNDNVKRAFYQVHYFVYPLFSLLELLTNAACKDPTGFDLAYVTELDPLWADDELAFILNPESVIFANPVAQLACAADCVAASAGFPLSPLFWCAGCQGSVYPLTGNVGNTRSGGGVGSSVLLAQRMLYKLHREGLLWGSAGPLAMCGKIPMPILPKGQYKTQLVHPIPETIGAGAAHPFCCQPLGRTTTLWGLGKEFPVKGEDFAYLIWRKRNCCASP